MVSSARFIFIFFSTSDSILDNLPELLTECRVHKAGKKKRSLLHLYAVRVVVCVCVCVCVHVSACACVCAAVKQTA